MAKYRMYVEKGRFSSVEESAFSENNIDFNDYNSWEACSECFGAVDLKNTLAYFKGIDIDIYEDDSEFSFGDTLIYIGNSMAKKAAEKYNLSYFDILSNEEYRISVNKREDKTIVLIYGKGREGTLFGIASYMEYHGMRFISPGVGGTFYNEALDKSDKECDISDKPMFKTREAFSSFINDKRYDFLLWLYHNKFNTIHLKYFTNHNIIKKLCLNMSCGGHQIWYQYMDINQEYPYSHKLFKKEGYPEDPYEISPYFKGDVNGDGILTYGEAHPEWFAESDGVRKLSRDYKAYNERMYSTGDFICTTNEDGTDEFIRLYVNSLIDGENKHLDKINFMALDNGTWCQCERCKDAGTYSYRLLMLAYKLDKAIKKATEEGRITRKIFISIPAYHETLTPPDRPLPDDFDYERISVIFYVIERCYLHNINDEKCEETNKYLYDRLMAWVNGYYKGDITIGEYYNVSSFSNMPFVLSERMKNDIPFYYNIGARHMHYMHMTASNWGVMALNNYLFAKLMWNIGYDLEELKKEYFLSKYQSDALNMAEIYDKLERVCGNSKYIKHYQYIHDVRRSMFAELVAGKKDMFDFKHIKFDKRCDDYQAGPSLTETVEGYEECFNEYMKLFKNRKEPWFTEDYEQLEYGLYMLKYMYYCAFKLIKEDNEEIEEKIKYYSEKLTSITNPLKGYDSGKMFKNGMTATFMLEN